MALIVEDGTLVTNANSYISADEFVAWADSRGIEYPSIDELEQKIFRAMDYIEQLNFAGIKRDQNQSLQWPRDRVFIDGYSVSATEIPQTLKLAVYEAIKLEIDGDSKIAASDRETVSETVGDISVTYKSNSGMKRSTPALNRALQKIVISQMAVSRS